MIRWRGAPACQVAVNVAEQRTEALKRFGTRALLQTFPEDIKDLGPVCVRIWRLHIPKLYTS